MTENAFWFLVRFTTKRSINLNTGLRLNFAVWVKLYTLLVECSSKVKVTGQSSHAREEIIRQMVGATSNEDFLVGHILW